VFREPTLVQFPDAWARTGRGPTAANAMIIKRATKLRDWMNVIATSLELLEVNEAVYSSWQARLRYEPLCKH